MLFLTRHNSVTRTRHVMHSDPLQETFPSFTRKRAVSILGASWPCPRDRDFERCMRRSWILPLEAVGVLV